MSGEDSDTPKRLRNYIRLRQNYFEHPVLMACADEVPAAMHLWPVLIGKGRMGAHPVDNKSGAITTTINRLARDAYVSIDHVAPALAQLQEGGLILVSAEGQNVIRIVVNKLFPWQLMPGSSTARADESKANASREKAPLGSGEAAPKQRVSSPEREEEREEEEEKKETTSLVRKERTDQIQNVFAYWCKVERETGGLGSKGKGRPPKLTKERRAKINARLEDDYSAADLKMAIAFYARDPHHLGETNGTRYTDLITTLKNGAKVEAGIAGYESRGALLASHSASSSIDTSLLVHIERTIGRDLSADEEASLTSGSLTADEFLAEIVGAA